MTTSLPTPAAPPLSLKADVLVLGGGPAGAWAAVAAADGGASVILADKGYLGTSGATAPSNTGTWCVPPGEDRRAAVERRWARTLGGGDRRQMLRTVDQCYLGLLRLAEWGYPFPRDASGDLYVANLRGPDYMRFMRARVLAAGIKVLDHLGCQEAGRLRPRETTAALATARWALTAALARPETRGIHRRSDFPDMREGPVRRIILRGIDHIRVAVEAEDAVQVGRAS